MIVATSAPKYIKDTYVHNYLIHVSPTMWPSSRRNNTKVECIKAEINGVLETETSVRISTATLLQVLPLTIHIHVF